MLNSAIIYDWNTHLPIVERQQSKDQVEIFDETLRDGLQSASLRTPPLEARLQLIELMLQLGIHHANLGFPGAGSKHYDEAFWLLNEVSKAKLPMRFACAARTHPHDIQAVIDLSQKLGVPIELHVFLGSSPIRAELEDWDKTKLCELTKAAVSQGIRANLEVSFVTEDTTRSSPEMLEALFELAIAEGATRLILCDTVGNAMPAGVEALVIWTRDLIARQRTPIALDWHGHNDRGLATINALVAVAAGCDRIHATALGIGERSGNVAIEQLLVNLKLLNYIKSDLIQLPEYCAFVSQIMDINMPVNQPIVGKDAFSTSTGVHAAAILKAIEKNRLDLSDTVYSSVPASMIGRKQQILIGPMSGKSNVIAWLRNNNILYDEALIDHILLLAKNSDRSLEDRALLNICSKWQELPLALTA